MMKLGKPLFFWGKEPMVDFFLNPLISMGSLAPESGFNQLRIRPGCLFFWLREGVLIIHDELLVMQEIISALGMLWNQAMCCPF